ncbi:hypothetical protein L1049_015766 [Liquidambar formosana]|uniref:Uncharacterized protein n=1 Tax=Liquidambar formosana TaxID=63359 RepID=A0AAP0X009_LIQFO
MGIYLSLNDFRQVPIPEFIGNLSNLKFLNLSSSNFKGTILRLRSNAFDGNISPQLCQLRSLEILDLALNRISGPIPRCIRNFAAMAELGSARSYIYNPYTAYQERLLVPWKGRLFIYSRILLSGEIPRELMRLVGLISVNLSNNHLTGIIPQEIGALAYLQSLDLSRNHLSCSIPASMSNLPFLSALNLSYNELSGKIPRGSQFDTFEASSYIRNPHHNINSALLSNTVLLATTLILKHHAYKIYIHEFDLIKTC